jgi:hypothetical protein
MDIETRDEIIRQLNGVNNIYRNGRPFLTVELSDKFADLTSKLRKAFEGVYTGNLSRSHPGVAPQHSDEYQKDYLEAVSILRSPHGIEHLENEIIKEMRTELHTN